MRRKGKTDYAKNKKWITRIATTVVVDGSVGAGWNTLPQRLTDSAD